MPAAPASPVVTPASSPALRIGYTLRPIGWADIVVYTAGREAHLSASYLTDALRDFADAAVALTTGQRQAFCSWESEPGEHLWLVEREPDGDAVRVRLLSDATLLRWLAPTDEQLATRRLMGDAIEQDDTGALLEHLDEKTEVVHDVMPLADWIAVVRDVLADVHRTYGDQGYAGLWSGDDHPFPHRQAAALSAWLTARAVC